MTKQKHTYRSWQQRAVLFAAAAGISLTLASVRLFHLQIMAGEQYEDQVDANRFFTVIAAKERGVLLDRYGGQLVYNQPQYFTLENPEQLYGAQVPIDQATALQLMAEESGHVAIQTTRWYPLGPIGAHGIGYTGPVTAEDIERQPQLRASDVIGKFGLERRYDELLTGTAAKQVFEVDALGRKKRLVSEVPGKPGTSLTTTLDPYLMRVAYDALGERTGAVVIQDVKSGGIIALVSTPSFDPNLLARRESDQDKERERRAAVSSMFSHPKQLFFNRAIGGSYPPGSVFKLVTAIAGLETESVTTETTVIDEGVLTVGEYSYGNWYFSQYGRVEGEIALQKSLARSNDIYFYKAAEWTGPTKLAEYAQLFGYGSKTGIELPGEASGFIPTPAWKEEQQGERWFLGNTYHFGIGQGDVLVTPLQVAQMTQGVVNRGVLCQPRLLTMDVQQCQTLGLDDEHLSVVLSGLIDACSTGGTAFPFFEWNTTHPTAAEAGAYAALAGGAVACKTGTAEFGGTTQDNRKRTHGWFTMALNTSTGLLQETPPVATESATLAALPDYGDRAAWLQLIENTGFPELITITVLVESDEAGPYREGSRDAAPVAKKIVDWMYGIEDAVTVVPPPNTIAE